MPGRREDLRSFEVANQGRGVWWRQCNFTYRLVCVLSVSVCPDEGFYLSKRMDGPSAIDAISLSLGGRTSRRAH